MSNFIINGGSSLCGEIEIDTAKNAILPILAGSILCNGVVKINKCTKYSDVLKMCNILKALGSKTKFVGDTLVIDNRNLKYAYISNDLTKDIRSSFFALGPMLARFKRAKISMPGGCLIGTRGVDIHLKLLEELGVCIKSLHGYIYSSFNKIVSKELYLPFPSVGATENAMMFACACDGTFKLHNVAKEPEIVDLANFLNKMGAKIKGAGTNCIEIVGVESFSGVSYTPIPDRIITGTFLIAGAITRGNIKLLSCCPKHVMPLINILKKAGCNIKICKNEIVISCKTRLKSLGRVDTAPYPAFPTDLQSQITTLASTCQGTSLVKENIFETRFKFVPELAKMGAKINVENNLAIVDGVSQLFGADVEATDLRGGVSLILAGLCAKGYTTLHGVEIIDRGYYKIEKQLKKLGAKIRRQKREKT